MDSTFEADNVRDIWCAALGVETADDDDNFFTLGGNSLSAIAFMERIESSLGIELPIQVLFLKGSLAEIIDECVRRRADMRSIAAAQA